MPVGPQAFSLGSLDKVWRTSSFVIGELRELYHWVLMCDCGWYCVCQKLSNRALSIGRYAVQSWKWDCICYLIRLGSVMSWSGSLMLEKWIGGLYRLRMLFIACLGHVESVSHLFSVACWIC